MRAVSRCRSSSLLCAEMEPHKFLIVQEFSKFDFHGGHVELDLAPCNLAAMGDDVCDIAAPKAQRLDVELVMSVDEELYKTDFVGDAFRLRQCLINVVDNSLKFTPPGGEVLVRMEVCEDSAGMLPVQPPGSRAAPAEAPAGASEGSGAAPACCVPDCAAQQKAAIEIGAPQLPLTAPRRSDTGSTGQPQDRRSWPSPCRLGPALAAAKPTAAPGLTRSSSLGSVAPVCRQGVASSDDDGGWRGCSSGGSSGGRGRGQRRESPSRTATPLRGRSACDGTGTRAPLNAFSDGNISRSLSWGFLYDPFDVDGQRQARRLCCSDSPSALSCSARHAWMKPCRLKPRHCTAGAPPGTQV